MNRLSPERTRWLLIVAFAVAMAWMESATVFYLRAMVDRVVPYQENPLPMYGVFGPIELVREAATLVMIATAGLLAGSTRQSRIGYMALAFGAWDILYYVFLRIMTGWPRSLFDWDVLFLIPLPWWGPVLAPACIALLMIAWGTFVTQWPDRAPATPIPRALWGVTAIGIGLALAVFMADALRAVPGGLDVVRQVLPNTFNWPVFCAALLLMATPVAHMGWQMASRGRGARAG